MFELGLTGVAGLTQWIVLRYGSEWEWIRRIGGVGGVHDGLLAAKHIC